MSMVACRDVAVDLSLAAEFGGSLMGSNNLKKVSNRFLACCVLWVLRESRKELDFFRCINVWYFCNSI